MVIKNEYLVIKNELPCMHTIKETSVIKMNYPKLDCNNFINSKKYLVPPSMFKEIISFNGRNSFKLTDEETVDKSIKEIEVVLNKSR